MFGARTGLLRAFRAAAKALDLSLEPLGFTNCFSVPHGDQGQSIKILKYAIGVLV